MDDVTVRVAKNVAVVSVLSFEAMAEQSAQTVHRNAVSRQWRFATTPACARKEDVHACQRSLAYLDLQKVADQ